MIRSNVRGRQHSKWLLLAGLAILIIAAFPTGMQMARALRLLASIRRLALGDSGQSLPVVERIIQRHSAAKTLEAIVYRSTRSLPTTAIILSPGISELGWHHPYLVALSRFLADNGFLVLTPDLKAFRDLRVSPEPMEEMIFWLKAIRTLEEGRQTQHVGLAGISFSGTLALMAAVRPEARDSVDFVLGVGCYYNLLEISREWFAPDPATADAGFYATKFYARWLIMDTSLELLPTDRDRQFIHTVLLDLLTQKKPPSPDPDLSAEARRWHMLAVNIHQSDPLLEDTIKNHLRPLLFQKLDPGRAAAEISCPVFLIHGAYDDLIPSDQSRQLKGKIARAETHLLITPFLTHTHAPSVSLNWSQKLSATWEGLGFLYNFAGILR